MSTLELICVGVALTIAGDTACALPATGRGLMNIPRAALEQSNTAISRAESRSITVSL